MSRGIRFTKTSDAVHKRVTILLFGEPKSGKTTLAKTVPLTSDDKLLYVAADPGQLALRDRNFVVAQPENGVLDEAFFDAVLEHVRTQGNQYEWIFVDGVDEVADAILKGKLKSDTNSLRAFGRMAEYVEAWLKAIRNTEGVNVVFVTHVEKVDVGDGEVRFIPSFPGKEIQKHVNEWFDMIGCVRVVKGEGGELRHVIQFRKDSDLRYEVGDRAGVTRPLEEPHLGKLVKKIHDAGYETKGTWQEPKVDNAWLKSLGKGKTEAEKDEIIKLSFAIFGVPVKELTQAQGAQLVARLAEKVTA